MTTPQDPTPQSTTPPAPAEAEADWLLAPPATPPAPQTTAPPATAWPSPPQEPPAAPSPAPAPPVAPHPGFGPPAAPVPPGFGPPAPPQYGQPAPPQYAPPQYGQPAPYPQQPAEGPEFMAVDRHNSVVVDSAGVAFEDHGYSAEFPWHEIRSVHYKAGPNGKTLMMAVIHVDGRFYECVVDAKNRDLLGQWFTQLAAILGYYKPLA